MGFREIGWSGMYWIHLAQDHDQWQTLGDPDMSLWIPQNAEKKLKI
jgi:hypothetical protein